MTRDISGASTIPTGFPGVDRIVQTREPKRSYRQVALQPKREQSTATLELAGDGGKYRATFDVGAA